MMTTKSRSLLGAALALFLFGGISAGVAGQASRPAAPGSADSEMLTEIRGLRADLAQAMSTNIRAQLLVGRLQLQEQRMNTLSAQLGEVRRLLADEESARADAAASVDQIQRSLEAGEVPQEQRAELEAHVRAMKQELSRVSPRLQELRSQEADISGQLVSEQGRWIEFNSRLDEIERSLPQGGGSTVR